MEDSSGALHLSTLNRNWGACIPGNVCERAAHHTQQHTCEAQPSVFNKGCHRREELSPQDMRLRWKAAAPVWSLRAAGVNLLIAALSSSAVCSFYISLHACVWTSEVLSVKSISNKYGIWLPVWIYCSSQTVDAQMQHWLQGLLIEITAPKGSLHPITLFY